MQGFCAIGFLLLVTEHLKHMFPLPWVKHVIFNNKNNLLRQSSQCASCVREAPCFFHVGFTAPSPHSLSVLSETSGRGEPVSAALWALALRSAVGGPTQGADLKQTVGRTS